MINARRGSTILLRNFRKLLHDFRLFLTVVVLVLFFYVWLTDDLRRFCDTFNVGATPFALFVVSTDNTYAYNLMLYLFLMLVCDAPFIDAGVLPMMQRTGRLYWFFGTWIYLAIMSAAYWLMVWISGVISIIGYCEWSMEWGQVFTSLLNTGEIPNLAGTIRYLTYDNALSAFLISWFLKSSLCMLFSQFIWIVNLRSRRNYGIILPVILVLFNGYIGGWFVDRSWMYWSPATLAMLGVLNIDGSVPIQPSLRTAIFTLIILNMISSVVVYILSNHASIEINSLNS